MTTVQELFDRAAAASVEPSTPTEDVDAISLATSPISVGPTGMGPPEPVPPLELQAAGEASIAPQAAAGLASTEYVPRHDPARRPGSLTAQEMDAALDKLERLAFTLDSKWQLGPTPIRIGADAVIGLIPVVGDVFTTGYAAYIVLKAARLGLPVDKQRRLWFRVAKDSLFGSVPIVGSVVDTWYKANERNINDILEYFGRPNLAIQRSERKRWQDLQAKRPLQVQDSSVSAAGAAQAAQQQPIGQPTQVVAMPVQEPAAVSSSSAAPRPGTTVPPVQSVTSLPSALGDIFSLRSWQSVSSITSVGDDVARALRGTLGIRSAAAFDRR